MAEQSPVSGVAKQISLHLGIEVTPAEVKAMKPEEAGGRADGRHQVSWRQLGTELQAVTVKEGKLAEDRNVIVKHVLTLSQKVDMQCFETGLPGKGKAKPGVKTKKGQKQLALFLKQKNEQRKKEKRATKVVPKDVQFV